MKDRYYLLRIVQDIEPEVLGPFDNIEDRDKRALELFDANPGRDGIFPLTVSTVLKPSELTPEIEIASYSGMFFEREVNPG